MNEGQAGRGDGVKKRRRGVKGGQRTRLRGARAGGKEGVRGEGRMSERIASCGSLYDSTNLLLQYCNNGEPLLLSAQQAQHNTRPQLNLEGILHVLLNMCKLTQNVLTKTFTEWKTIIQLFIR